MSDNVAALQCKNFAVCIYFTFSESVLIIYLVLKPTTYNRLTSLYVLRCGGIVVILQALAPAPTPADRPRFVNGGGVCRS